ncbi:MAG: all-trans-retinol 13,14-reductase [Planctomycetota bacterium]|jgi:all-trans-retinol 13,14-reductase
MGTFKPTVSDPANSSSLQGVSANASGERRGVEIEDRYQVIVIGAGFGGLVTAALLAKAGKSVLVIDQHSIAGGNASVFRRKGYEFDVGVHYLGECGPNEAIPRVLEACGVHDARFQELDPNAIDTFSFPDFEFRFPRGLDRYRKNLLDRFPEERGGIDRYLRALEDVDRLKHASYRPERLIWTIPRVLPLLRHAPTTQR